VYSINRAKSAPAAASGGAEDGSSARRILDERLARGDIDSDEYRERRRALDS
jgi:putative membrane protein